MITIKLQVFREPRFYLLFVLLMVAGVAMRYISPEYRTLPCSVADDLGGLSHRDAGVARAGVDTAGAPATAIVEALRDLFACNAKPSSARKPSVASIGADARDALPGVLVLAVLFTLVLGTDVAERPQLQSRLSPPLTGSEGTDAQLHRRVRELVVRARQLRVAIAYAVLSCLATVMNPPSFASGAVHVGWSGHLCALIIAAVLAGTWGVHVLAHSSRSAFTLSTEVAFFGVMIAGAIALAVAMPYRMLAPETSASLGLDALRWFAVVRLILLPACAAAAAFAWVVVHRRYLRLPLRPWPPRPGRADAAA